MASFKHINALGALRRIETISIGENEPLVRTVTLWRRFLLYRLAHLPLKKINGVEVTPEVRSVFITTACGVRVQVLLPCLVSTATLTVCCGWAM
jgi:hypothetical protein